MNTTTENKTILATSICTQCGAKYNGNENCISCGDCAPIRRKVSNEEPAVYVGTYNKYNNGSIGGAWLSLEGHDKESFYEACKELHSDESDPEFMFQDFQNFPREFYGESGFDSAFWDWLELDEEDRELLAQYCDAIGCEGLTIEDARDAFHGTADSFAEFAERTAEDCGDIPKNLPSWIVIDWEASWDCNLHYDYATSEDDNGMIWFFLNH
jgi:antirestriction protein